LLSPPTPPSRYGDTASSTRCPIRMLRLSVSTPSVVESRKAFLAAHATQLLSVLRRRPKVMPNERPRAAWSAHNRNPGRSPRRVPVRADILRSISLRNATFAPESGRRRYATLAPEAVIRKAISTSRRSVERGLERARSRHARCQGEATGRREADGQRRDNLASLGAKELRRGRPFTD
jgi:hypothetical protein